MTNETLKVIGFLLESCEEKNRIIEQQRQAIAELQAKLEAPAKGNKPVK